MQRKILALALVLSLLAATLVGCGKKEEEQVSAPVEVIPQEEVVLTVSGGWTDCRALDIVASNFTAEYPNCTIVYEYLQDYYPSLEKRLVSDKTVDLFFTTNIQEGSALLPYALDLNSCEGLDLSGTFDGLIKNFMYREGTSDSAKLYALPLGAEMRGLYVNKTLLDSLNIEMPTDQASLLEACQTLKDNGYIPFHGNPGDFSQTLIYPWICNLIANADDPQAAWDRVNAHEAGLSEMFREPLEFLYSLTENYNYDYKTAQAELGLYTDTTDVAYAYDFLNIRKNGETYEKADDLGQVAFMPSPMSLKSVIDKAKEDYHSEIVYEFIMAPIGVDGGFAYMSPAHGIAANKNSENVEWSIKFLDYLFRPENNEIFAEAFNVVPNTGEAFSYIKSLFDVPEDHISHLGQVTFDYGFYDMLRSTMVEISKANNPKYMLDDGNGNLTLYPLDHFMEGLEAVIKEQ